MSKQKRSCFEQLANLATTLTFIAGVWQFILYRRDKEIEASLSFNNTHLSPEMYASIHKYQLNQMEFIVFKEIFEVNNSSGYKFFNERISEKIKHSEVEYFRVLKFIINVRLCVEGDVCAKNMISPFLNSDAINFLLTTYPFLCEYKKNKASLDDENSKEIINEIEKTEVFFLSQNLICNR